MTTKKVLQALDGVRAGQLDAAVAELLALGDPAFVIRRLKHYQRQPDHREPATQLAEAYAAAREAQSNAKRRDAPPRAASFHAPLAPAAVAHAPSEAIDFAHPEDFLAWASADWAASPTLNFDTLQHVDVWAVVALGALRLAERTRKPKVMGETSGPARFAHALGLSELSGGPAYSLHEPQRTVRLTRIRAAKEIEPTADRMASLVAPGSVDTRLAIRHVLVELLRNVVQHSGDTLGAVAAAQAMGPLQRRDRPMVQLAVADAGIGIPRHLQRQHPHLTDYRQALERALLPHISGTFEEGLSGSFENAGLGLYVISEMARQTEGRLLIATTGASLVLQAPSPDGPGHPRFLVPEGTGFPGTLVAFEIPTDSVHDYHALMKSILDKTRERMPKRVSDRWLSFEPAKEQARLVSLVAIRENTPAALQMARSELEPAILRREAIELDFQGIDLCTQSWLHALLYEAVRLAWAKRVQIHILNADPAVREGLRFLEAYALGG